MLVSYKWPQDYVDIPWDQKSWLTGDYGGLEVEGVTPLAANLDRAHVGFVQKCRNTHKLTV